MIFILQIFIFLLIVLIEGYGCPSIDWEFCDQLKWNYRWFGIGCYSVTVVLIACLFELNVFEPV